MLKNARLITQHDVIKKVAFIVSKYFGGFISIILLIMGLLSLISDIYELYYLGIFLWLVLSFSFFRNISKPIHITIAVELLTILYYSCTYTTVSWFMFPYLKKIMKTSHNTSFMSDLSEIMTKEFMYTVVLPYSEKTFSDKVNIFFDALQNYPFYFSIFYLSTIGFYTIRFFSTEMFNQATNGLSK